MFSLEKVTFFAGKNMGFPRFFSNFFLQNCKKKLPQKKWLIQTMVQLIMSLVWELCTHQKRSICNVRQTH